MAELNEFHTELFFLGLYVRESGVRLDTATDRVDWVQEERGVVYRTVSADEVLTHLSQSPPESYRVQSSLQKAEIDLIGIQPGGEIPAHYHERSDTVVWCISCDTGAQCYDQGVYRALVPNEVLRIHRTAPHGFKNESSSTLWILTLGYPNIAEDDVHPV